MIHIVSRTIIDKEVAIEITIGTVREIQLVILPVLPLLLIAQSARAVEYTDYVSAEE